MKEFNLSAWALAHRPLVLLLIIASLFAGIFSFMRLGRLEDPKFNVPQMTAVVAWPGASAQEMQDLVLNRIEIAMQELDNVDWVNSFARPGFGGITLRMKGGLSKAELEAAWYRVRKKVGDIRASLPEGIKGPIFNDEYNDVYSVLYAVSAPDLSMPELLTIAEELKRQIRAVPTVNKVDIIGKQAERIYVDVSSQRLAAAGVTPAAVIDALAGQHATGPNGAADGRQDRVQVRAASRANSAAEIGNTSLTVGTRQLRLSDVAAVYPGVEDPPSFTVRHNGVQVLSIGVTMASNGNILQLGKALDARVDTLRANLPVGVDIVKYADQPAIVADSVGEFEHSFVEALAIVLAVSFVALGWRSGLVVAASVPLVLGIVAGVMLFAGWNLDRISLGALIIALGLLVDDAIIATEIMVVKMEEGWESVRAATFTYASTAFPMLTGTLVTIAGFMPVGFAKSLAGEYAGGIFWVNAVALLTSWLVAVVFTPYLGVLLLPKPDGKRVPHLAYQSLPYIHFRAGVDWCMSRRRLILGATALAFVAAGAGMLLVPQQFFPTASRLELLVELRAREGASFEATQTEVRRVEQVLKKEAAVKDFTAYTGASAPRFYLSLPTELPSPSFAQFVVVTADAQQRERLRLRLQKMFTDDVAFSNVRGRVVRLEFGPPVGFPVQFRIIGTDARTVRDIAYAVRTVVQQSPLVRDTQLDWNEQARALAVDVDQDKAKSLGIAVGDIQAHLQIMLSGTAAVQLRKGEELVDVVVRGNAGERHALERLADYQLPSCQGGAVPLSQVATISTTFEEPVLWRRNREMAITVRADAADGVQAPSASAAIWPTLKSIIDKLPPGYRIEAGGAIEESDNANTALFAVFPAMIAVTLLLLMLQLKSFARVLIVFMTAPLGLIGVVPALLVFNAPFGFVALLGLIALGGMLMRNSVILVDQIDRNIADGAAPWSAVIEATVQRARPVILTAAAAMLAMIPLSGSVFWGPMAIAIMGGLIVGTAMTLAFVPALYLAWFRIHKPGSASGAA